jgi:hypothetical protein
LELGSGPGQILLENLHGQPATMPDIVSPDSSGGIMVLLKITLSQRTGYPSGEEVRLCNNPQSRGMSAIMNKTNYTTHILSALAIFIAGLASAQTTIDSTTRTVTTSNFQVVWNTGTDTEAITTLNWKGGSNLTGTLGLDTCGGSLPGSVPYFGNSYAPPDPQVGGLALVGGGTITPTGTVPWLGQILTSGTAQVTVNSNSTNCPPSSAGINVQTTYRFFDPGHAGVNWFGLQRVFDFTQTAFPHDFRPYIPRLLSPGYTEVLYPAPGGVLVVADVYSCGTGCTGPQAAPGAAPLSPVWDSTQGWFAIHNPTTLQGVVVKRIPSADPQGSEIAAQLWIDYDAGPPGTNPSSFLLLSPAAGFTGGLVTEVETFCFYNSTIWTPSLIPPTGCLNAPVTLTPWTLTFAGQPVGVVSAPKAAILKNVGPDAVTIGGIVSSGDFGQVNDCPATIAAGASCNIAVVFKPSGTGIRSGSVSIIDVFKNSPQTLSLAGLGL